MNLRVQGYRALALLMLLLIAATITSGVRVSRAYQEIGWIDFPCDVRFVEKEACIIPVDLEDWTPPKVEVVFDQYIAGWKGFRCDYHRSDTNVLVLNTSVLDLNIERDGDMIKVNDTSLGTGAEFQAVNVLEFNPWLISRMHFTNLGSAPYCGQQSNTRTVVLSGQYGTERAPLKGAFILMVLALGLIAVYRKLRSVT